MQNGVFMDNNILLSLQITALGMGLVFLGIILLWGMMSLLTLLTSPKHEKPSQLEQEPVNERALREKVAAIAVATELAKQRESGVNSFPLPPTAFVSAWQLTMRTRQLDREARPK
jgi:Na+-transporting methylmalonyl-CoA/oxaloacetate decarboxylase gamma subunit